jgi:4-hydroxy-3-methylbut-2-enyl diphosphate reductase
MLGDIVHNEKVVAMIRGIGIKKIKRLSDGHGKTLIIRAHGCSGRTLKQAIKLGYRVIDATCPMVKEIHKTARRLEDTGHKVIIIGDKRHDEVQGIVGQLNTPAIVIDALDNLDFNKLKNVRKAGIVVQSTQNLDKVLAILEILRRHIPQINFHNTICNPTKIKQNEIKTMPLENSVMIIIGSKTSANTKRIYEISKSLNPRSYWVNSAKEIKHSWLISARNVGITAGASTPESSIKEIIARIKKQSFYRRSG